MECPNGLVSRECKGERLDLPASLVGEHVPPPSLVCLAARS